MYLSVGLVFAIILVLASPIIWIVWWKLADLGEMAGSRDRAEYAGTPSRRHLPAA